MDNPYRPLVDLVPDGWGQAMAAPPPPDPPPGSFAEFVSAFAFGGLWNRPQLSVRERRIAVLAVLAAQGRADAARMHAASALELGDLSTSDIEEIAVTVSVYAGVAAGVSLNTLNQELARERDT